MLPARCLLEVLHEDALFRICRFLPARALLDTGFACRELQQRTEQCLELWRSLCEHLLGGTLLKLHEGCWGPGAPDARAASFYHRLFRTAWAFETLFYDHQLRHELLRSVEDAQKGQAAPGTQGEPSKSLKEELLCMTGHTAEALGPLIVQIGGMRNTVGPSDTVHVTVIDLAAGCLRRPALAQDSAQPPQRMRHATCVVQAPFLPPAAFPEAILVLGGHDGNLNSDECGNPREAVQTLLFLQVTREDGSEVRWVEVPSSGPAPLHLYNHACAAFAGGRKVCVFGGDIPADDPEFARIRLRRRAAFVYVLDVAAQRWEAVPTTGPGPAWRSYHAAVAHTSLLDGRDYFVTFGGTEEHCQPLSAGELADMRGYQLDLGSFEWRQGPVDGYRPGARLRFGAARWGRHLLIHGGHGDVSARNYVARLNLTTLRWSEVDFANAPPPLPPNAFETGSPQAGCVVGGARPTRSGPRILTRLVVLRLKDPEAVGGGAEAQGSAEAEAEAASGSDESDSEGAQLVRLRVVGPDGEMRVLQMPVAMLMALRQRAESEEELLQLLHALIRRQAEADARAAQSDDGGE